MIFYRRLRHFVRDTTYQNTCQVCLFTITNTHVHSLKIRLYVCYAKSLQSCPTLCDPIDGSPPGSPVPGILEARTLEWVSISFSNAWKWKVKGKSLSCVRLFAIPWTAAHQAPPSMGFSKQEYWSGVPLPSPVVYIYYPIYNGISLSHKNEQNNAICSNMDGPRVVLSEVSQTQKDKYHVILLICEI